MKIEIKIILKNIEGWSVNWNDEKETINELAELKSDIHRAIAKDCGIDFASIEVEEAKVTIPNKGGENDRQPAVMPSLPNGKRVLAALKELSDCFTDEERKTMFGNKA